MKRFTVLLLAALVLLLSVGGGLFAQEHQKDTWYIGFGLGSGQLWMEDDTFEDVFEGADGTDFSPRIGLNFGVGLILNPNLHAGLDISAMRQKVEFDDVDSYMTYQINNYYAAASFFPWETGFSVKGGLGYNVAMIDAKDDYGEESTEFYNGYGFLVGAGYDFWLGESFNLGLHAEYSKQYYFDDEDFNDSQFINVYLSFYWF